MNDTQIWPTEPRMYIDENSIPHNEKAERLNGRLAMLGVIAALGSYAVTGQMIPVSYTHLTLPTKRIV